MTLNVAFLGKLGSGKTCVVNKLCNTSFRSVMCAESCTRENQFGKTGRYGITVIDTPGFCSSVDTDAHIRAQRDAIEGRQLSGIYAIVKFGAASDMAESLNRLMDFAGTDEVRIIVTHTDIASQYQGFDAHTTMVDLSSLMGVPIDKILLVGKETEASEIEEFLHSTLHEPMHFNVEREQEAYAASLTVGARRFNKEIDEAEAKLRAAQEALLLVSKSEANPVNLHLVASVTQSSAQQLVHNTKNDIVKRAAELTPEQRQVVLDRIEEALIRPLRELPKCSATVRSTHKRQKGKKRKKGRVHLHHYNNNERRFTVEFVINDSAQWSVNCCWEGNEIAIKDFLHLDLASNATCVPNKQPKRVSDDLEDVQAQNQDYVTLQPPFSAIAEEDSDDESFRNRNAKQAFRTPTDIPEETGAEPTQASGGNSFSYPTEDSSGIEAQILYDAALEPLTISTVEQDSGSAYAESPHGVQAKEASILENASDDVDIVANRQKWDNGPLTESTSSAMITEEDSCTNGSLHHNLESNDVSRGSVATSCPMNQHAEGQGGGKGPDVQQEDRARDRENSSANTTTEVCCGCSLWSILSSFLSNSR